MEEEKSKPMLKKAILDVVYNQKKSNNPPETNQTFERLIKDGISKEEANRLIGCAVAAEIYYMNKEMKPFNLKRYLNNLNNLPKLPE